MLGQPASSQTVCRPSRRTSDFSSVYSGPVRSRVLIHSGLRSIGTWLLRTSRRSSFRPAGSTLVPAEGVGAAGSLMIPTVPPAHDRPGTEQRSSRGGRGPADGFRPERARGGWQRGLELRGVLRVQRLALALGSGAGAAGRGARGVQLAGALDAGGVGGLLRQVVGRRCGGVQRRVVRAGRRRAGGGAVLGVAVGHLLRLLAQIGVGGRRVARRGLGGGGRLWGGAWGAGHGGVASPGVVWGVEPVLVESGGVRGPGSSR